MGYIDCDAHLRESDRTWEYFDASERQYRPQTVVLMDSDPGLPAAEQWLVQDQRFARTDRVYGLPNAAQYYEAFPPGSVSLDDVRARVRWMDDAGVDVQVLISTFWLAIHIDNPLAEAALARSYNRWIAAATADSGGRLAWSLKAPTRMMDRALEELEFGKAHGAVSVLFQGSEHGLFLSDPYFWPLYERAQDLDLVIGVHVGSNSLIFQRHKGNETVFTAASEVQKAFFTVLVSDLTDRFPRLRWAFLEAGASWIPSLMLMASRLGEGAARRYGVHLADIEAEMAERNLFVACQIDDDLPYLLQHWDAGSLVLGSDWGHLDMGSDPEAHRVLSERTDVDATELQRIVDTNGRRLYAIDPAFRPADGHRGVTTT